jgi:hypothetical protein
MYEVFSLRERRHVLYHREAGLSVRSGMSTPHGHRDEHGNFETDEQGYLKLCYDGFCVEWHTRNARALNTVGGGLMGGLGGALLGGLVGGPRGAAAGAALGAAAGGSVGYSTTPNPVTCYVGGVPIYPPHRLGRNRGWGTALPGRSST